MSEGHFRILVGREIMGFGHMASSLKYLLRET